MPCPLLESDDYPDYIKSILKEIDAGNDEELKACACSFLKTVLDDQQECAEQMTDGKLAIFPFCIIDTETDPTTISVPGSPDNYWIYPVGMSLDDLMLFYWQNYEVSLNGRDMISCPDLVPSNVGPCGDIRKKYLGSYGEKSAEKSNVKYLVCPSVFTAHQNRTCVPNEQLYECDQCHAINEWGGLIAFSDWSTSGAYPICYRYNQKYYPNFSFVSNSLSSGQRFYGLKGQAKLKIKNNSYSFSMGDSFDIQCSLNLKDASVSI